MSNSAKLKLDRAEEHLDTFKEEAADWIEGKPFELIDELDPSPPNSESAHGGACRRFRLQSVDSVPDRLSVLIGDCLFQMRSALDHLALALAKHHTPNMNEREISGSEFPIFHDKPMNAKTAQRKIGCIHPAAQSAIRRDQPHLQGRNYRSHLLWQLHELNRVDKHRLLAACVPTPIGRDRNGEGRRSVGFVVPEEGMNIGNFLYAYANVGELIPEAVLFQYGATPADPNRDINMQPHIPIEIAFDKDTAVPLEPVSPTLENILRFVREDVVAELSKFL